MRLLLWLFLLPALVFAAPESVIDGGGNVHFLGLKRDPAKFLELKKTAPKFLLTAPVTVPGKLDLSPLVSLPENQGQCGSCWAFAIIKALRSAFMLLGIDPGRLAFNYLVNNCGPVKEFGCNGGDFDAGKNFLNGMGPWLEVKDPYLQTDNGRCLGLPAAATAVAWKVVGPGTRPPTFQEKAIILNQRHQLVVDVAVCNPWDRYQGGILTHSDCGPESINHMINVNGYDCQTSVDSQGNCVFNAQGEPINGDGFLIAMNNWGENMGWGEVNLSNGHGGYMRTRDHVSAIGDTTMYFEIKQPGPPPTPIPTPPAPKPVNGGWSAWTPCAGGYQYRACNNPVPANGGAGCLGPSTQACVAPKQCNGFLCKLWCGLPWCD